MLFLYKERFETLCVYGGGGGHGIPGLSHARASYILSPIKKDLKDYS